MPLILPMLGMQPQLMPNPMDTGQLINPGAGGFSAQQAPPITMPDNRYAPSEQLPYNAQPQNWYGYGNGPARPVSGPVPQDNYAALLRLLNNIFGFSQ